MIELQKARTIDDAIEQIKCVARSNPRWAKLFVEQMRITSVRELQAVMHALMRPDLSEESIQSPIRTAIYGGDFEDCAALAICLAEALELSYEIRVKGLSLFLFVEGIEVLHK